MLLPPAAEPKKLFDEPVVLVLPAPKPTKVLFCPGISMLLGVVDAPAPTPTNVLELTKTPPVTVSNRLPLMLYCVVAFTILPDRVPPTMPLPLMLKLEPACGEFVF